MNVACPISGKLGNERVARLNAFMVLAALAAFIFTKEEIIVYAAAADFLIRGFINPKYSPLSITSSFILKLLRVKPRMEDMARKVFAAKIGTFFCVIMAVFLLADMQTASFITAGAVMFFAALESFFGFCVACKLYPLICHTSN
ncbi:MAG: DUF4395 domain-containing protein [Planctomycetes bacterium]|nr:DUF4395 domain-containing protein [Planctomycetota bacterium]